MREAAKADALSEAFRYDVGTLRTDLLKHAEDRDIVKDAAGAPVLDAHGVPQPGPFQTLLRTDQAAWDRFVEDPGPSRPALCRPCRSLTLPAADAWCRLPQGGGVLHGRPCEDTEGMVYVLAPLSPPSSRRPRLLC